MVDLVDSKKIELSVDEIIQKAALNTNAPYDFSNVKNYISKELNIPGTQFLRQGNTLFIIHYIKKGQGVFRAINADTSNNYMESSIEFVKAAYNMGYDILYAQFTDPILANLFRYVLKKQPNPQMGYNIRKTKNGFLGTIKLGPTRYKNNEGEQ
jgi:hypothetical protein